MGRLGSGTASYAAVVILFCWLSPATAAADMEGYRNLKVQVGGCNGVTCTMREGLQSGLTMVELEGSFPRWGGNMLRVVVVPSGTKQIALEIKAGTMSNGKFSAGLTAYKLPEGSYKFIVVSPSQNVLAQGDILVRRASSRDMATNETRPAPGLAGIWRGINGTSGVLELHAGGTYSFQGQSMGTWALSSDGVIFTGQPFAFAGNHAAIKSEGQVLMFIKGPTALYFKKTN